MGATDRYGDQATPGCLASAEGLRSSNLAKALRELEARGLFTRRAAQVDRRQVQVALTKTVAKRCTWCVADVTAGHPPLWRRFFRKKNAALFARRVDR